LSIGTEPLGKTVKKRREVLSIQHRKGVKKGKGSGGRNTGKMAFLLSGREFQRKKKKSLILEEIRRRGEGKMRREEGCLGTLKGRRREKSHKSEVRDEKGGKSPKQLGITSLKRKRGKTEA